MTATTGSQWVTAEQLARMPDDGNRYELVEGVLHMMSPAGGRHGKITVRLTTRLAVYVEAHQLGTVFAAETGFLTHRDPDTVRAPDVAFVSRERLEPLGEVVGFVPLAPDLVVEVTSPSDTYSQIEDKVMAWLRAGVRMVLVVDPATRSVRLQRGTGVGLVLDDRQEIDVGDLVPGWRVPVGEIFG